MTKAERELSFMGVTSFPTVLQRMQRLRRLVWNEEIHTAQFDVYTVDWVNRWPMTTEYLDLF